jgi:hypothetical protein
MWDRLGRMDGPAWDVFLFLPMQLYIELPRLFNVGGCMEEMIKKKKKVQHACMGKWKVHRSLYCLAIAVERQSCNPGPAIRVISFSYN